MPEGEDRAMAGIIDFVEVGVAFGLPADGPADDRDRYITDPTNEPGFETIHFTSDFADFTREIRDIRGSDLIEQFGHFTTGFALTDTALIDDPEARSLGNYLFVGRETYRVADLFRLNVGDPFGENPPVKNHEAAE